MFVFRDGAGQGAASRNDRKAGSPIIGTARHIETTAPVTRAPTTGIHQAMRAPPQPTYGQHGGEHPADDEHHRGDGAPETTLRVVGELPLDAEHRHRLIHDRGEIEVADRGDHDVHEPVGEERNRHQPIDRVPARRRFVGRCPLAGGGLRSRRGDHRTCGVGAGGRIVDDDLIEGRESGSASLLLGRGEFAVTRALIGHAVMLSAAPLGHSQREMGSSPPRETGSSALRPRRRGRPGPAHRAAPRHPDAVPSAART